MFLCIVDGLGYGDEDESKLGCGDTERFLKGADGGTSGEGSRWIEGGDPPYA